MGTVLERRTIENTEKQQHNAMINERYRRLLDAVEDQFATATVEEERAYAPTYTPTEPVYAQETPVAEHTPEVREYVPSALAASLFTPDKFERFEELQQEIVETVENIVAPAQPQVAVKAETTPQYTLTPLAKKLAAAFAMLVMVMLALIGVNSYILQQKAVRVQGLEETRARLVQEQQELQRYIQELQTDESIIQRATEAGLLG